MIPQFIRAWLPAANIENPDVRNIVNNHKEKTMNHIRSEDDFESQSYKEFMSNTARKIREDNLKAIEDEMNRPMFPKKDTPQPTTLGDLWKKGMAKKANPEDIQEDVENLSEDGRYNVTISFENLTPEVVSWLMGNMKSYIHMARHIDIEQSETLTFEQELTDLLNRHSIDSKTGTADWILATHVITMLNAVEDLNDARKEFNK